MMKVLRVSSVLGVLALAACAPPPATSGTAADETAIRALAPKFAEAWNKGDVPAMTAMATDDYESVAPDGSVVKGKAAYEEMGKKEVAGRAGLGLKLSVETTYVHWLGADTAAAGGTYTVAGVPAGMGSGKGSWMTVDKKGADGQWRMATGLVSEFVPPPAMPVPAATPAPKGKGK